MKSIENNIEQTYIINKSKFITKLYRVNDEKETINILDSLKTEYKDATHICYAYIVGNTKRMSDDGEPSGTAGMPILGVLENNELNYILAVVIRYFGGIKLGAGGLVRAYSNCVSESLKNNITEYQLGKQIKVTFDYNNVKEIDNLLKEEEIISKDFNEQITYIVNLKAINLPNYVKIDIIKDIYVKS